MNESYTEASRDVSFLPFSQLGLMLSMLISKQRKGFELPGLCEQVRYIKRTQVLTRAVDQLCLVTTPSSECDDGQVRSHSDAELSSGMSISSIVLALFVSRCFVNSFYSAMKRMQMMLGV